MNEKELATLLRAALRCIQSINSNANFLNNVVKFPYDIKAISDRLDKYHSEFTVYEQAFIDAVDAATGYAGIEEFVTAMHDPACDYMKLENGSLFNSCYEVFDAAYQLGIRMKLETSNAS